MTLTDIINQNFAQIIEVCILVLAYVISYAMTWQKVKDRLASIEKRMGELEDKIKDVNVIQVTLAQIQTDILWIKQKLNQN